MKQWTKTVLIAAPLLVLGSVYAFASSSGNVSFSVQPAHSQQSAGSSTNSNNIHATANHTNTTQTTNTTNTPAVVQNPFLVPGLTDGDTSTSNTFSSANTTNQISLASIRHFNLHAMTAQGEIQVNYTVDGKGIAKLEGKADGKNVHLRGDQASQFMLAILNQFQLLPVLDTVSNDGSAQVIVPAGVQIQELQVQLNNQQTFHLQGQETQQDTNQQENGNGNSHGKGHDKQKHNASSNENDQGEDD